MNDLNTRLSALLDKRPELRPKSDTGQGILTYGHDGPWAFDASVLNLSDQEAHAIIFRAMVEKLPSCYLKEDSAGCWFVRSSPDEPIAFGDTAIDALVAYWEAQP